MRHRVASRDGHLLGDPLENVIFSISTAAVADLLRFVQGLHVSFTLIPDQNSGPHS